MINKQLVPTPCFDSQIQNLMVVRVIDPVTTQPHELLERCHSDSIVEHGLVRHRLRVRAEKFTMDRHYEAMVSELRSAVTQLSTEC